MNSKYVDKTDIICPQIYGEVKYLCDDERQKRAEDEGVSENEVDQADCPQGYADLEAKEGIIY